MVGKQSANQTMEELPLNPRGIRFQADFITTSHEAQLLHIFKHELEWPASRNPGGARLSLHYGYTFDYKTFGVDPDIPYKPFPAWLRPLIPQDVGGSGSEAGGESKGGRDPDQVCLQYYPPGAGIPPHVDTHSAYDELYALSLGSAVIMQFRRDKTKIKAKAEAKATEDGEENSVKNEMGKEMEEKEKERETVDVDLPPRSMMQMSGDVRLHWEHGIKKRKKDVLADGTVRPRGDRWSITYRWLRPGGECECGDQRLCDTAQRRAGVEREYRWKQQEQKQQEQKPMGQKGEEERGDDIVEPQMHEAVPQVLGGDEEVGEGEGEGLGKSGGDTSMDRCAHDNSNILSSPL